MLVTSNQDVDAVSRMKDLIYDYKQLYKKWEIQLPMGKCTGDPKQDLIRLFAKQFEGMGLPPREYDKDMKPDAVPVQLPAGNVSESLWETFKKECDCLEKPEIITRITKATEWSHNLVYVNKPNGELHFCLVTHTINCYVVRCPHFNSNFNDVFMTLSRGSTSQLWM